MACLFSATLTMLLISSCNSFTPSSRRKSSCSPLLYTVDSVTDGHNVQINPNWIPMELVELAAEDLHMTDEDFIETYADIEAYTSCDDDGDDFHECDFFKNYLGPTKWLHLTAEAHQSINEMHFSIWKDVWAHPHASVDVADTVSKEVLRYYKEFMLEPRTSSSVKCPTDRPLVRVKVVPASFGSEGFEDAVWEATEGLMEQSATQENGTPNEAHHSTSVTDYCKSITFIVAAPDLFTDPSLLEGGSSPQAEFEPDRFREFTATLREKMVLFSKMEGVPLDDAIQLAPFHPMWDLTDGAGGVSGASFPYPCVAVSTKIEV